MSLLDRILKPGGKFGWTAVDITPEGLFGVSVLPPTEMGGRPSVVACASVVDASIDTPQALVRLSKNISVNGCAWVVPLERRQYDILVIEEPPVRADEMEQSVRWAISTMINYPVTEAQVSWMKIPTEKLMPNRPPHIYAIAARLETVNANRELFKQAKIPLRAIDIQETAHRNLARLAAKPGEGVALLAVGKRGMQLTVTFDGDLYLDRHVDENILGANIDESSRERAIERVILQVQRSLDFVVRTLPFIEINRLMLAPMPAQYGLREHITENMPVPVEPLDLARIFDLSRAPQLREEERQADYLVALGAALRFMDKTA